MLENNSKLGLLEKENANVTVVNTVFKPNIFGVYNVINLIYTFCVKLEALVTKQSTSHHLFLLPGINNNDLLRNGIVLLKDRKVDLQVKGIVVAASDSVHIQHCVEYGYSWCFRIQVIYKWNAYKSSKNTVSKQSEKVMVESSFSSEKIWRRFCKKLINERTGNEVSSKKKYR